MPVRNKYDDIFKITHQTCNKCVDIHAHLPSSQYQTASRTASPKVPATSRARHLLASTDHTPQFFVVDPNMECTSGRVMAERWDLCPDGDRNGSTRG